MSTPNAAQNANTSASAPAGNRRDAQARPVPRKSWLRRHGVTLFLVFVLLVGLGLLLYPSISNWWNNLHQSRVVMDYQQTVTDMTDEQYDAMLKAARAYNKELGKTGQKWILTDAEKAEYESLLNVDGTGVMGYIQIPKINVQLPIYHGTDEAVLQSSIGHIEGTSLPVGGKSSHCVLSGHRGLPSARLFTDLDQLVEGDTFTLTVLDMTLTYQVDQIRIVEPDDISDLQIEEGRDYCTLVTCTPYGINTQRLLVRGHRIPNVNGNARILAEAIQIRPIYIIPFVLGAALLVVLVYTFITTGRRRSIGGAQAAYLAERGLQRPPSEILEHWPEHGK